MVDVIFDVDTGHDDAIAIMAALARPEKINILGITTVAGNQTVEKVTDNTLKVLDYLGCPVPVAAGLTRPIRYPLEVQPKAHGESGMDGPILPGAKSRALGIHAVEFLRKTLSENDKKVTIIALAPLTNLGFLIRMYPEVLSKIEKIEIMGGSLYSGNITAKAEFNIYHDPDAAKIVFESGVPIVMSGLEVCRRAAIPHAAMEQLKGKGKVSQLVYELLYFFCHYSRDRGWDSSEIFDLTPVFHILWPELFTSKYYHIEIETESAMYRGMTAADLRGDRDRTKDGVEVLLEVDQKKYQALFFETVAKLEDMLGQG